MELSLFDRIAPAVALFTVVLPLLAWGLFPNACKTILRALLDTGEELSEEEEEYTMRILSNRVQHSVNMDLDELFPNEKEEIPTGGNEVKEMDLEPHITTPYYFERKYHGTKINPEEQKQKVLG